VIDGDLIAALDKTGWNRDSVQLAIDATAYRATAREQIAEEKLDREGRLIFKECFVRGMSYRSWQDAHTGDLCASLHLAHAPKRYEMFRLSRCEEFYALDHREMVEAFRDRFLAAEKRLNPLMLAA